MIQQYGPLKKMFNYIETHNIQSLNVFEKKTGAINLNQNVKGIIKAYIVHRNMLLELEQES